jgi:NAD-reducing hydrogenase large subunit
MKRITIDPVSRIEGHARITIHLDDQGHVAETELHVTQVRGFEKFTEGRPFYEMPGITARICGICPISHLLASSKACDEIMAVRIPPAARKLRELAHCAQFVQSHALSFFYLSAPDLLLGMESDPAMRNVAGVIAQHPDLARDGANGCTPRGLSPEALPPRPPPSFAIAFSLTCPPPRRSRNAR